MHDLKEDGLLIIKNFLNEDILHNLISESDELFHEHNFLRGSRRSLFLSRRPNLFYKSIQDTLYAIRSVNMLELSLQIYAVIKDSKINDNNEWILTQVDCFRENNIEPLPWHTDRREGMIRGILYLSDSDEESGSLRYMVGTHKRDYYVKHKLDRDKVYELTDKKIDYNGNKHKLGRDKVYELTDKKIDCNGNAGDLILFDPMGFHSNNPRMNTRTHLVFEFQPKSVHGYPKSNLTLLSSHLTDMVIDNIEVFCCVPEGAHGQTDIWLKKNPEFAPTNVLFKSTLVSMMKDISQLLSSISWLRNLFNRMKSMIR